MVPESPSVCFRCKMCKVCFLTMSEIERHLKATNHYIRASSNNNNNNNNNNISTKEKSTAKNNESSVGGGDDKPLNLSSKSSFPPLPPVKEDKIDLTVSSEDSGRECDDGQQTNSKCSMKAEKGLGRPLKTEGEKMKKEEGSKTAFSRKVSIEKLDSSTPPPPEKSVCMKNATTQNNIADIETDTVSSTSADPPLPQDKKLDTPVVADTNEAEAETQVIQVDESEEPTTTHHSRKNGVLKEEDKAHRRSSGTPLKMVKKQEKSCATTTLGDERDPEMADTQVVFDDKEEKTISTTALTPPSSQISTSTPEEVMEVEENADGSSQTENNNEESCDMEENENNEPEENKNMDKKEQPKLKQSTTKSRAKNNNNNNNNSSKKVGSDQKQKYRCKHCGEKFDFPVQVHVHMRKVHFTAGKMNPSRRESNKSSRRSSVNAPTAHNNNNNDPAKVNFQMYPLRSLYARAKRRTRSMQSDGGSATRRNSLGQRVPDERKEKKTRKAMTFSCKHCGKKFPLLNQMKIHLHTVHPETVKKVMKTNLIEGLRKRKFFKSSKRRFLGSKRKGTAQPQLVQAENRPLRVSTRSVSRSADSEPETVRMSTRRSSVAKSEKSGVASSASSRRSSTRARDHQDNMRSVKVETKARESETEENVCAQGVTEKTRQEKLRYNSSSSSGSNNKERSVEDRNISMAEEDSAEEEKTPEFKLESLMQESRDGGEEEEDTIYNDSDCMIIDTVETILYALTSRRSQTCPNCNKYCKFAGNFKLHIKACMNLDDDLEVRTNFENVAAKSEPVPDESMEGEGEEEEGGEEEEDGEVGGAEDDVETDIGEEYEGSDLDLSASIPYYQKLDYRRCWECGFIVSKFHNLSRHLKQRHNINMGTKEMHAKQSEILRSK